MKLKIVQHLVMVLLAATLPVILLALIFKNISSANAILSIMIPVGLMSFGNRPGKKKMIVELIATFCASVAMCVIMSYAAV